LRTLLGHRVARSSAACSSAAVDPDDAGFTSAVYKQTWYGGNVGPETATTGGGRFAMHVLGLARRNRRRRPTDHRGQGVPKPARYVHDGLDRRALKTEEKNTEPRTHEFSYVDTSKLATPAMTRAWTTPMARARRSSSCRQTQQVRSCLRQPPA
jgi:hypothetical protein